MSRNRLYCETQTEKCPKDNILQCPFTRSTTKSPQLFAHRPHQVQNKACGTHADHQNTRPHKVQKPCSGKLQSLTVKSGQQIPRCIWQVCKRLAPCVCRKPHGGCALTQPGRWWQLIHGTRMPGHELSQCNSCTAKIVLRFLEGHG